MFVVYLFYNSFSFVNNIIDRFNQRVCRKKGKKRKKNSISFKFLHFLPYGTEKFSSKWGLLTFFTLFLYNYPKFNNRIPYLISKIASQTKDLYIIFHHECVKAGCETIFCQKI